MNFRKRRCLRKFFGFIILLLNMNSIFCLINSTKTQRYENNDKYDLKSTATKISDKLLKAVYVELGVSSMQKIYDSLEFVTIANNEERVVEKISKKLEDKLTVSFDILNGIKTEIEKYSNSNMGLPISSEIYFFPTSTENTLWQKEFLNSDEGKNVTTFKRNSYEDKYLSHLFLDQLSNITHLGLKQLYFLSSSDLKKRAYINPGYIEYDDTYMWHLYLSRTKFKRNNIIIGLDLGNTNSYKLINLIKLLAKQVILMSDSSDQIGIMAFGHEWSSPYITGYNCQTSRQAPLTTEECTVSPSNTKNTILFNRFIDSLSKFNGTVNHQIAFKQLLKAVQLNFESNFNETVMLLYITASSFSPHNETAAILQMIEQGQSNYNVPIVINTIYVAHEVKSVLYQEHFLRDIAQMSFCKYNIDSAKTKPQLGLMQSINSSSNLGLVVSRIFNTLNYSRIIDIEPGVSLPSWQETTKDFVATVYVSCGQNIDLGLLGLDVHFSNLAEDITYYSTQGQYTYAFLLNIDGLVLMHPSFSRPIVTYEQPNFIDVSYYEKHENFTSVRNLILNQEKGVEEILSYNDTLKYVWHRVLHWYIVCIVVKESEKIPKRPQKTIFEESSSHYNLLHHRLDLLPAPTLCRHLNQISTLDAGTIYLSASCFQSPYSYLRGMAGMSVSALTLQSYMAYIKDNTRLLANPGLKEEVRNDVTVLSHILDYLMRQHLHGDLYKYIVRRYVATVNGVMQMFPGSILDVELEPTRRSWFVRAVEHPGKIVLTSPYLDAGGAGYIVTISHTIYEKSPTGEHTNTVAVMAMDVTFGYIHKMLLEIVPYCSVHETVKCFIIDDKGYLIYHPNLIESNGKGPIEQQHIIHKESLVANDLLNHKGFVKKILCNNYADGTIQRYYKFNTSISSVLSNVVHGEHCVKYYITAIPETNAFIGIVNLTCNDVATFCPCSTVDRLCLICNRVEQNECECPCECPLNYDNQTCPRNSKDLKDNQLCAPVMENPPFSPNSMYYSIAAGLKPCHPFLCEIHTTYDSCVGLLGCEWCHLDIDGETKLQNPFCTSLTTCFHGILGSVSPYRDVQLEAMSSDDLFVSTYSSVGPAAGSIVALCFILALVFYCYRQYSLQFMERLHPNSAPRRMQGVQMSNIDVDNFNDEATSHQDKLLANFPNDIGPISPYCITTEYRKPSTAVDSDLGYSTMTPHEESERLSFALIELDSLEDDYNTSDAISTNTSVMAYKSPKHEPRSLSDSETPPGTTILSNRHCILAPVTVHRNMETI